MLVIAHGEVSEYCEKHGLIICGEHIGEIESYEGNCPVLVTDQDMSENAFYGLKLKMLRRGVELISVRHSDRAMSEFVAFLAQTDRREKSGGRRRFGSGSEAEMAVVRKIFEMHDAGKKLREIHENEEISYLDGRKIGISTIQWIIKNRNKYERK